MNELTPNQIRRLLPGRSEAFYAANSVAPKPSHTIPQQADGSEPMDNPQAKEGSLQRFKVRITRFGVKLLDPDNLAGAKLLIDELRKTELIPNDNPESIELVLCQVKAPKDQRGTLIEITPL